MDERIIAPRAPEPPRPVSFPLLATLAPVAGSVVIWLVTSSPFALVFALLGPLVGVAGMADGRWQGRRQAGRERRRYERELDAARQTVLAHNARERERLLRTLPPASRLVGSVHPDALRWRGERPLVLGFGPVPSALSWDGAAPPELRPLTLVDDAPIGVDPRLGVAVAGPALVADAVLRGLVLQLAHALPPGELELVGPDGWRWLQALPHAAADRDPAGADTVGGEPRVVDWRTPGAEGVLAAVGEPSAAPRGCRVLLSVVGGELRVLHHPDQGFPAVLRPDPVSAEQAEVFADRLAQAAAAAGLGAAGTAPPERLGLAVLPAEQSSSRLGLPATFLAGAAGPVSVDLVRDGPHAVVGGTTGSGKSELLTSWILALCAGRSAESVSVLLVDFKGGASFAPLAGLPHVAGVVTDLDERSAHRAMLSLRAELRHRERLLAGAGARSIEELDSAVVLPRLVIVVDEFAAVLTDFPELHGLFADLASRGRSLGVHLVLCTQRPAGVVRDAVLANCALRLSLRVNNAADSVAVVGTDAAARLSGAPPGRAFLARDGAPPEEVQVALARAEDVGRVGLLAPPAGPVRRPWCDELPVRLRPDAVSAVPRGLAFGLADLPEEQRQPPAVYDPREDGNLAVLGAHRSGRSTLLGVLAGRPGVGEVRVLPADVEGAWDALARLGDELGAAGPVPGLVMVDDADALLARFPAEYGQEFADRLAAVMRDGPRLGVTTVLALRRASAAMQPLLTLCDARLLLRMADRQEHLVAAGSGALFDPAARPGAGEWRGSRVQVMLGEPLVVPSSPEPVRLDAVPRPLAIVTARPARFRQLVDGTGGEVLALDDRAGSGGDLTVRIGEPGGPVVVIGDVEAWQARWGLLAALRPRMAVIVDGATAAEFRAVTGLRELPPPLAPGSDAFWLLRPGEAPCRALL